MTNRDHGPAPGQSPGAMMVDLLAGVSRLVQGELALARAEAAERLQSARQAVLQVAVAVVLGIAAINLLAAAFVATLIAMGLSPIWASVLVGAVLLLAALGSAKAAARLLRDAGTPSRRTSASIRRDVQTLQTMVRPDAAT